MQDIAREYHKKKLPIFPVRVSLTKEGKAHKQPLVKEWEKITTRDFERLDFSKANAIGMPTGKTTGTLVLDLDLGSDVSGRELPITVSQRTGSGGLHYFYKWIEGVGNTVGLENKIDIRADGGYVVIAPSWHPKGEYEWLVAPKDVPLADAPKWLIEKLKIKKKAHIPLAYGVSDGTRNQSAASVIGHVIRYMHEDYWLDFGLGGLREWNKRNNPPLPDDELITIFKSIAARQHAQRKK